LFFFATKEGKPYDIPIYTSLKLVAAQCH
jgi:hypothetical protein